MVNIFLSTTGSYGDMPDGTVGVVRAPVPAMTPGTFHELSVSIGFGFVPIGQDLRYIYYTPRQDRGNLDNNVYRIDVENGLDTPELIASPIIGRSYGKVTLALPIAPNDVILFGRTKIARIQGDDVLWEIALTNLYSLSLADAACVAGGNITVLYQRPDFSNFRPQNYKAFTFSLDSPESSSNANTWDTYNIDWDAIEAVDPETFFWVDSAPLLGLVSPSLEYAIVISQTRSDDGWDQFQLSICTDVFTDVNPSASYYARVGEELYQNTTYIKLTGMTIVEVGADEVPLSLSTDDIVLPDPPGGTTWDISPWFTFAIEFGAAPTPEAFWTNLRRAVEVI